MTQMTKLASRPRSSLGDNLSISSVKAAIEGAFNDEPSLVKKFLYMIENDRTQLQFVTDVALYVQDLRSEHKMEIDRLRGKAYTPHPMDEARDGWGKKRKLGEDALGVEVDALDADTAGKDINSPWDSLLIPDISFSMPQRKKFHLEVARSKQQGIRATVGKSNKAETGLLYSEIEHIICVPVPEKASPQWNFCVIPRFGDGVVFPPPEQPILEAMVWTVPEPKSKAGSEDIPAPTSRENITAAIEKAGIKIITPDAAEFHSAIPQPHAKHETAHHVKAFRGSKEGYLYFLPTGILFAFKKPLLFFSFHLITSISYTSILQRTFNLNIAVSTTAPLSTTAPEFEFGMIDQADYAGIDAYIQKHGLDDASMAAERRAKKVNISGSKGDQGNAGEDEQTNDEGGELAKAQREADELAVAKGNGDEDMDSEEEDENFDPGSEGQSDGSGTESEEEDGDGEGGQENGDEEMDDDDEEEAN
ncbi:hypothetical protein MMC25_002101 [Agyrium rufum]|nr:hypothetical protein [Agyrium rufum]